MKRYLLGLKGESNYQRPIGRLRSGLHVDLIPEPENSFDARAIRAAIPGGETIGYAPRDSWLQRAILDEGNVARARIAQITGGSPNAPSRGVVLEVWLSDDYSEALPAFVAEHQEAVATKPRSGGFISGFLKGIKGK